MSLDAIKKQILQPFIDETLSNLKLMAEMDGHADEGFADDINNFRFKGYAICAETTGTIEGVMLMHHYVETAVALGNAVRKNVLGENEEFEDINDAMADALAEWGNTVVGRATKALGALQLSIQFEPPYFVFDTDTMKSILTGVTDIISVPVHIDGVGRFYFNYLLRSVNAQFNASAAPVIADPQELKSIHSIAPGHSVNLNSNHKIMLVDDMKMVRTSMRRYLKDLGYTNTVEAVNGKEAVEKNKIEKPDFIFMDVVMPEMTGNEALREIRKTSPDVPIVMLTSVADANIIQECEQLGISGYIIKPLTTHTGPNTLSKFIQC